jgi:hypothetical protein
MSTVQANRFTDSSSGVLAPISSVMRNRIINGAMVIDQRNSGASVTLTSGGNFITDRFVGYEDTDGTMTGQQVFKSSNSVNAPNGFTNSLLFTTGTADTSLAASQYSAFGQSIEGLNLVDLDWGSATASTVTLSFWVRSSLTGTFSGSIRNAAANRSYVFTYTISSANTWEQKSITIAGDTSGTWLTTNGTGINLIFSLGAGSNFSSSTTNAWQAGSFFSATSSTSVIGTAGATFYITGVQLERGTQATSFEYRQYQQEFALCQRYYETGSARWRAYDTNAAVVWTNFFKVTKRATPTMTGTSSPGNSLLTPDSFSLQAQGSGTVDTGAVAWTASIEL